MNKKIKIILVGALLSASTLFASGSHPNIYLGTSTIEDADQAYTFGVGYDAVKHIYKGLEMGFGLNVFWSNPGDTYQTNTNAGLDFLVGYDFNKNFQVPISIRGGVGYGVGKIGESATMSGLEYSAAVEWDITKKLGVGAKYLQQDFDADFVGGTVPASTQNLLGYFYWKFKAGK